MSLLKLYTKKIFDIFSANWKNFLIIGIIYLLVFVIFAPTSNLIDNQLNDKIETIKTSGHILNLLIIFAIGMLIISIFAISIHNFFIYVLTKAISAGDFNFRKLLKQNLKNFWKISLFSLLELLIITLSIILFILPGIYLLFIFSFALIIMANDNLSIINSLKKAYRVFNQNLWKNIGLILLWKFIVLLGWIVGSWLRINGLVTLADWFVTTALIYLMIYEPLTLEKNNIELKPEND